MEDGGERVTVPGAGRDVGPGGRGVARGGVGRGSLVGIRMERGVKSIASLLGILKAGGGYVPFDVSYPRETRRMDD